MANAIYSDIQADTTGGLLEVVFIPNSGTTGPGTFWALWRGPGDPTFTTFTMSPYQLTDGTNPLMGDSASSFGLTYGRDGTDRFWLTFLVYGESTISDWWTASVGGKMGFTRFT
jgi:hypothetical protein